MKCPKCGTLLIKGANFCHQCGLNVFQLPRKETKLTAPTDLETNYHEYVDLGLPSGTLWATMNVGAKKVTEIGDYFAWGETVPKDNYDWEEKGEYKWGVHNDDEEKNFGMTKYRDVDDEAVLDLEDDAARQNWGGDWRMPTVEELSELWNCTWRWTNSYKRSGTKGFVIKGHNGNSIFVPASGIYEGDSLSLVGSYGFFWSATLGTYGPDYAQRLGFNSKLYVFVDDERCNGIPVRPVRSGSRKK